MADRPTVSKSAYTMPANNRCQTCGEVAISLHRNPRENTWHCYECFFVDHRCVRCKRYNTEGDFAFAPGSDTHKVCPDCASILLHDFIEGKKADEYYETKGDR